MNEDTEDDAPEPIVHDGGLNFGKPFQANAGKAQALLDQAGGGLCWGFCDHAKIEGSGRCYEFPGPPD